MANGQRNRILLVHGWSADYRSFLPMQGWLTSQGFDPQTVYFGQYDSMEDHVTFDDMAVGMHARIQELADNGQISLAPFSLDAVVHSTGGPAIRHWLNYYLRNICKGDFSKCPLKRLIMLAPANFGSRLAQQGESALAKIFMGGLSHGFETGKHVLEGLELGSPTLWKIAGQDLFSGTKFYPVDPDKGPFVFVFSGTDTFGKLKGLVASGANEDGSDGTVRASAASLNSILIQSEFITNPARSTTSVTIQRNAPIAFRLVKGRNHATIVSEGGEVDSEVAVLIQRCLQVNDGKGYEALRTAFDAETKQIHEAEAGNGVHAFQQVIFRVKDQMGNAVLDYRLDFHVVDDTIRSSSWGEGSEGVLDQLRKYIDETNFLQDRVIAHVQKHSVDPSYRTFFINIDALQELRAMMQKKDPKCYIGMNLDALGRTRNLTYETDKIRYINVSSPLGNMNGQTIDFFEPNTSTLVDITLKSTPNDRVVIVWKSSEKNKFPSW